MLILKFSINKLLGPVKVCSLNDRERQRKIKKKRGFIYSIMKFNTAIKNKSSLTQLKENN